MPKPFSLSPHQARQQKKDLETKDKIVLASTREMNDVLRKAVEEVFAHYQKTGRYKDPDLSGMQEVTDEFYRRTVSSAVKSAERQVPGEKRLAAAPPPKGELPTGPEELDKALTNKRYWQRIMRRSRALTDRAKKAYLEKLRTQFKKILPILEMGDLSPKQIKRKIAEAWQAPAARAQTIFRTEATKYFASSQTAYFGDTREIIGFVFDSVKDTSRTSICASRHGLVYRPGTKLLEQNTPALHYNCRSHLIPLVNDAANRELLNDPRRDPEKVKVVPLPRGWKS